MSETAGTRPSAVLSHRVQCERIPKNNLLWEAVNVLHTCSFFVSSEASAVIKALGRWQERGTNLTCLLTKSHIIKRQTAQNGPLTALLLPSACQHAELTLNSTSVDLEVAAEATAFSTFKGFHRTAHVEG